MTDLTVALAQIDSRIGDLKGNAAKHLTAIRAAREGGAGLVVFPELSLTGYSVKDMHWDLVLRPSDSPLLEPFLRESDDCTILIGGIDESPGYGISNAAFLVDAGRVTTVHRKIYLPTYGMFEESRYFSPGASVRAVDTRAGRIGVLICEDLWHLSLPYLLALDRAEMIVCLAASPTRVAGNHEMLRIAEVNSEQHRSIARLLSVYLLFCNRTGFEDGVNFWGGSEIISPAGEVVARAKFFEEETIFATLTENEIRRARRLSRHFLDENRALTLAELNRIVSQSP